MEFTKEEYEAGIPIFRADSPPGGDKAFSKEDLDDFKFGIKKGLIHGKINVRGIPPLHFKGYEFGVYLKEIIEGEKNG